MRHLQSAASSNYIVGERPGIVAPRVVRLARYCRQAGKPFSIDRKFPGLYTARRAKLQNFWRREFGHSHALMHHLDRTAGHREEGTVNGNWRVIFRFGRISRGSQVAKWVRPITRSNVSEAEARFSVP